MGEKDMQIIADKFDVLKNATFLYPTEVCYALGCDATNTTLVKNIFSIKPRQKGKPVLVLMKDIAMCQQYIEWNETLEKLAQRYWPGPFTIVAPLRKDTDLSVLISDAAGYIAFRISNHQTPTQIIEQINCPIISTSADIEEQTNPYNFKQICRSFTHQGIHPDYAFDAGVLPEKVPATIIRVDKYQMIHIVRQGDVIVSQ